MHANSPSCLLDRPRNRPERILIWTSIPNTMTTTTLLRRMLALSLCENLKDGVQSNFATHGRRGCTYPICLVVVLWIVLEHFRLLLVHEISNQFIRTEFLSPFLVRGEPAYSQRFPLIIITIIWSYISKLNLTSNFRARRNRRSVRVSSLSL